MALNGTQLAEKAIKVGKAINPIIKEEVPKKDINEIMKKVRTHTHVSTHTQIIFLSLSFFNSLSLSLPLFLPLHLKHTNCLSHLLVCSLT
jgi:hypothetical protein